MTCRLCYTIAMRFTKTALLLFAPWAAAAMSISQVCELERPSDPASLSSLTFVSNGVYWSSTDWHPVLYEITIKKSSGGKPDGLDIVRKCPLEGAKDIEGIARDPLRGTVWAADEVKAVVAEYDPATGHCLSTLDVPRIFKKSRKTFGFESLAIRADGLEMWLANEESLLCDGPISTPENGTFVRIARFVRKDGKSPWSANGQWAYKCDKLAGSAPLDSCRSGLSDLCVLEDGTLLALEREYSFKPLPFLRCRIYSIDRTSATDISERDSLAPGTAEFTPVEKTLLYDANTGLTMYEGIAPGPMEADGSRLLLLVSDGDKMMSKNICVLKLEK